MTQPNTHSIKALGILLSYPNADIVLALPELALVLEQEACLSEKTRAALLELCQTLSRDGLLDAEERYTALFDGSRSLSLHLFEHVHGDARERGQALASLGEMYTARGVALRGRELPDYLPALCELMSLMPGDEQRALLVNLRAVLALLHRGLEERRSSYAAAIAALLELAGDDAVESASQALTADVHDAPATSHQDFDALDRDWEEAPVAFGPGAAHDSCKPKHQDVVPLARLTRSSTPRSSPL